MALTQRIETTTVEVIMPMVIDTILNENIFATRMLAKAKKLRSGRVKFPIKYQAGQSGGSFSGFDTFSTGASETRVNLEIEPRFYQIGVGLPLDELAINDTEGRVIDLVKVEMQSRAQDMADEVGDLFYGDGTGNSGKDFLGLEAIVDDGTNAPTYGSLSRATYTTLNSTVTAQATLTLASMRTLYNAIQDGSVKPSEIYTTKAVFGFYEQLLQPQERLTKTVDLFGKALANTSGYETLEFIGMPVISDRKCNSGIMYFLNTKYLDFYGFSGMPMTTKASVKGTIIEGNDYSDAPDMGFAWTGWREPINAAAFQGFIILGGELFSPNPKRHGKLTGVAGV